MIVEISHNVNFLKGHKNIFHTKQTCNAMVSRRRPNSNVALAPFWKMDYVCLKIEFEAYIIHFFQNEAKIKKSEWFKFFQPFLPIPWPNFRFLAHFVLNFYSKMCFWDIAIFCLFLAKNGLFSFNISKNLLSIPVFVIFYGY